MKLLRQLAIILVFLFIGFEFYVFPFPFVKSKLESNYLLKNIGSDTTLRFQKYDDFLGFKVKSGTLAMAGFPFTINVTGNVNSDSEICLQLVGYPGKVYSYILPKGKIDTTFQGELYDDEAEILYLHKEAKTGNLKLTFRLGQEVKNKL